MTILKSFFVFCCNWYIVIFAGSNEVLFINFYADWWVWFVTIFNFLKFKLTSCFVMITSNIALCMCNTTSEKIFIDYHTDFLICLCRCRFSQILAPVFEEASNKIKEEFPVSMVIINEHVYEDLSLRKSDKSWYLCSILFLF